ncbi:hypothetical protein G6F68_018602 [Rhizopus microsporus]|nr:hypothetical protein G6F68_018602 [Rhizopus microsporus]
MASLARASSEDFEAGGDDDDDALSEIEEFIRVAVLLLHGDQRTGIAAGEYKRRRRQLMDMAGEDAILVLPAAAEKWLPRAGSGAGADSRPSPWRGHPVLSRA